MTLCCSGAGVVADDRRCISSRSSNAESPDDEIMFAFAMGNIKRHDDTPKISGYTESVIPQFEDVVFRSHFRMGRATFMALLPK